MLRRLNICFRCHLVCRNDFRHPDVDTVATPLLSGKLPGGHVPLLAVDGPLQALQELGCPHNALLAVLSTPVLAVVGRRSPHHLDEGVPLHVRRVSAPRSAPPQPWGEPPGRSRSSGEAA